MFGNGLRKYLAVVVLVLSLQILAVTPAIGAHHPDFDQSFGKHQKVVDHQKTAMFLSLMMPGVGEWYLRDFDGGFPWAECILGHICCFVQVSSILDSVDGVKNERTRIDFWVSPNKAYVGD